MFYGTIFLLNLQTNYKSYKIGQLDLEQNKDEKLDLVKSERN